MIEILKTKKYFIYLPTIALLLLLAGTWFYLDDSRIKNTEELHGVLQDKVQESIANYLEKKYANLSNISFHKIWTKRTEREDRIQIFFSYSFESDQDQSKTFIDGEAFLVRSAGDVNKWILNDFKVTDSFLEFSEPMVIRSTYSN